MKSVEPSRPKLILVEGVPGSGKTTIAQHIQETLEAQGVRHHLFLEGHPDHPADYEATAYFSAQEFAHLLQQFPKQEELLKRLVEQRDGACFVPFLRPYRAGEISEELLAVLGDHDVYELDSVVLHRQCITKRWESFASQAAGGEATYIFECCFLQNPLVVLWGKHNRLTQALDQVRTLSDLIRPLNPFLIYLATGDVRATLEKAREERPQAWVEHVSAYFSEQAWGIDEGVEGYEGIIRFHELRQPLDLELLSSLELDTLILNAPERNWQEARIRVQEAVLVRFHC